MAVTIQEIARLSGLSHPTVSQILNNKGQLYRPETCRQVLDAARKLGYRPNSAARSLVRGRFACAALLMGSDSSRSMLPQRLLEGIHDGLAEHAMHLTVAKLPDEKLTSPDFVPKLLREWTADGLLINYNAMVPQRLIDLVQQYRLPSVWINSKHPADCVHPDDLGGGRQAVEHLLALGHKRIAYVSYTYGFNEQSPPHHYSAIDRYEGYAQAMRDAGLAPRFIHGTRFVDLHERIEFSRQWLAGDDRPTAVVINGTSIALPTFAAALSLGLRIPDDMSILTFAAELPPGQKGYDFGLETCVVPEYDEGKAAVKMLEEKIRQPSVPIPPGVIPMRLVPGYTCAPWRANPT